MIIDEVFVKKIIQPRPLKSHKGTFGRLLLIGGLYPYGGAIIMAALAAVNSGAGLVSVATDRDNITALHAHLPEAMAFDVTDKKELFQQIQAAQVILIGSGLGETDLAKEFFQQVLTATSKEQILVIDGSALNLLAKLDSPHLENLHVVLTPHQKEWERLSQVPISKQNDVSTQKALSQFPASTILVAKSHQTKIYDQQGQIGEIRVGGPYQATGGMGDTLAGMIAGFLAQFRKDMFASVAAATYLHSAIAEELSEKAYVVLPTRISQELPRWMKSLSEQNYK